MVASFGVAGTDAALAYLVEPLLKKIFADKDFTIFWLIPPGIVILSTFRGGCRFIQNYFISNAGQLAIQDIRNDLYKRTMGLSLRFFTGNPTGVLMSRILNDVGLMQNGVSNAITGILKESFTAFSLLGVIFYRNWQLALISFVVIPLTAVPAQKIGNRIKSYTKKSQGMVGDLSSILQETFSGVKVIKAFGLENREVDNFRECNLGYYRFLRKIIKYDSMHTPIMELITSFGLAAVILFGGLMVKGGRMTAAELFSFLTAMYMLYGPIKKLLSSYNGVQQAIGAAERVFDMMDQQSEITDPPHPVPIERAKGEVELRRVSFNYDGEDVLKDISIRASKGEIVALVGPSGGGKTTLVSLICRFYDATEGSILIDGIDLCSLSLNDLMRQIALVDQETILFNDTISNNIRYGKPDAPDEDVRRAAEMAFAHDFIVDMPEGYQTSIGDRGVRLSGGQRQRLCIARAILKDAPILLLDEATSALDTESEQMVQQALNNLMANRTTFVIAHRLSTILHADRIVVLDKGEIAQSGTHEELLEKGGLYKKLYDMQFKV